MTNTVHVSMRAALRNRLVALFMVAGLSLAAAFAPAQAAPISLDAHIGSYDSDEFLIGGGARIGFGTLTFHPNLQYVFVDNATVWSLNLDGTMTVIPAAVASGWVGAGVGFQHFSADGFDSQTDTVFNLLAGAGLNTFPLKPYLQFKYVVVDGEDPLVMTLGVRF